MIERLKVAVILLPMLLLFVRPVSLLFGRLKAGDPDMTIKIRFVDQKEMRIKNDQG